MNEFGVRTKIYFGDALPKLAEQMHRVYVVTDRFMAESGKISYITDRLAAAGAECAVFSEIDGEPDISVVSAGVQSLNRFVRGAAAGCDTVISLGGGAAIDAAKAVMYMAEQLGVNRPPFFVVIPSTSGTGSEVSRYAVISDKKDEAKYPLVDESFLPHAAVLDAQLVVSAPPSVTADTGIDAFTHAVEAFVSVDHTDFSDAMAEKAMKLVRSNLVKAFKNPGDMEARQAMHNASCMAGIAFSNAGLGLNHGMAHALGAHFHIPHGRANGILLPYVMSFNAGCHEQLTEVAERYARISRLLHLEGNSIRQSDLTLIRVIRGYIETLKMPATIKAAGVSEDKFYEALDDMAGDALADGCTATNPRKVTKAEIRQIYEKAYFGKLP